MYAYIDGYCERLGPGLWAEPWNAVTNIAFIVAAIVMFLRPDTRRHPLAVVLCVLLFTIGVGSGLFHTFANRLTAIADVVPIALFVLTYLYAANRHFMRLRPLYATGVTLLFFPYEWLAATAISEVIPWIGGSTAYVPIALLIFVYGFVVRGRLRRVSTHLFIGASLLSGSIFFRWLDDPICGSFPLGTHFMWHILNAVMLAWMIRTLTQHLADSEANADRRGAGCEAGERHVN